MLGDAKHTTDFFENYFGMDAEHSQALLAVHGAVHQSNVGVKYTWMGTGYISNMYFKMIANHPIYQFDQVLELFMTHNCIWLIIICSNLPIFPCSKSN